MLRRRELRELERVRSIAAARAVPVPIVRRHGSDDVSIILTVDFRTRGRLILRLRTRLARNRKRSTLP